MPGNTPESSDRIPLEQDAGSASETGESLSRFAWDELKTGLKSLLSGAQTAASGVLESLDLFDGAAENAVGERTAGDKAEGGKDTGDDEIEIIIKPPLDRPYRGEDIREDIKPGRYTASGGETVEDIARRHLGTGASRDLVEKYAKELGEANGVFPDEALEKGTEVLLPGHTAGGNVTIEGPDGTKLTYCPDGSRRVEHPDGSGHLQRPGKGGAYSERHWGPRAEDNYEVTRTADGRYLVADRPGEKAVDRTGSDDVRAERARLHELAEKHIFDPRELARFHSDMETFEARAQKQGVGEDEVGRTYKEVSRLFDHQGSQPLGAESRAIVAQQLIAQAARPTTVDQGYHNTCTVTSIETRLYTRSPSHVARVVADVATSGEFKAENGRVVKINQDSLYPDREAVSNPPEDGKRSHASQIFQVTAENLAWAEISAGRTPPGDYRYEQHEPKAGSSPPDTGERIVDYSKNPPEVLKTASGKEAEAGALSSDRMIQVHRMITGQQEKDFVIENGDVAGASSDAVLVRSEEDLKARLVELKQAGKLPVMISVHSENEPFWTDSGGGKAGGFGSWHVLTITDYDETTGRVSADNQWGDDSDHFGDRALSAKELFEATKEPARERRRQTSAKR